MPKAQPYTFATKLALAAILVVLADRLLFLRDLGWVMAAFCGAWLIACVIAEPAIRRHPWSLAGIALAAGMALLQAERPTALGFAIFWFALTGAVLAPRAEKLQDIRRWAMAVFCHAFVSVGGPVIDLVKARRMRRKLKRTSWLGLAGRAALPILGGLVFLGLFAMANPVISDVLGRLRGPQIDTTTVLRVMFWGLIAVAVWATLRPRWLRLTARGAPQTAGPPLLGVSVSSVTLSLIVFNAVFALQNALDIAFLWSGAALPDGLTYAEYAHRGVYVLIFTAMLAGLFVLVALRPGSDSASRPAVRWLVIGWVAQNGLLMASSGLRLGRYIEAYSLTQARIWAFAIIALVAVGLVLICWRMLRGKSSAWLVNANVLALFATLLSSTVVDTGALAAAWNVRHAREAGGGGQSIDLCYMSRLGVSALVPLSELQTRRLDAATADRVAWVRSRALLRLQYDQRQWSGWTWRGQRRLEAATRLAGGWREAPEERSRGRDCDGRIVNPIAATASMPDDTNGRLPVPLTAETATPSLPQDPEKPPVRRPSVDASPSA